MTTPVPPTIRLYLEDDHCFETNAQVWAVHANGHVDVHVNEVAFDRTCFHPGGGGQPPDRGRMQLSAGQVIEIESVRADAENILWHVCSSELSTDLINQTVKLSIDKERRLALMRYHTVLHVLNSIALRDYGGWITGVQIDTDYSRIDFKLENFSPTMIAALEEKVNAVLAGDHALRSYYISAEVFHQRDDLRRTLTAQPPIAHGRVRVVEIEGFDAQACGGTHMHNTNEVGKFSIFRTDNKGKNNKRFYVRLDSI